MGGNADERLTNDHDVHVTIYSVHTHTHATPGRGVLDEAQNLYKMGFPRGNTSV